MRENEKKISEANYLIAYVFIAQHATAPYIELGNGCSDWTTARV